MRIFYAAVSLILLIMACQPKALEIQKNGIFYEIAGDEIVDFAKGQENLLFIDIHTDWCLPCKKMDHIAFQDSAIVATLEQSFVPIKLNPDKSDSNKRFCKKHQVNRYPTFLILNTEAKEMARFTGYKEPEELLTILNSIHSFFNDTKLTKLRELWQNGSISFDDHRQLVLAAILIKDQVGKKIVTSYTDRLQLESYPYDYELLTLLNDHIFGLNHDQISYLRRHYQEDGFVLNTTKMQDLNSSLMFNIAKYYFAQIDSSIVNNDWDAFLANQEELLSLDNTRYGPNDLVALDELKLKFYRTNNPQAYFNQSVIKVNSQILNMSVEEAKAKDEKYRGSNYFIEEQYEKYGVVSNTDSLRVIMSENYRSATRGFELYDIAKTILKFYPNEPDKLEYAASVSRMSYDYFRHPMFYRLHADILLALGNRSRANEILSKAKQESYLYNDEQRTALDSMMLLY